MMGFLKRISFFSLALIFSGCASQKSLYYWGSYQPQIYQMYSEPGEAPPEQQLIKFEEDYQKAMSQNKRMPPGFHAHVGYLYFESGKMDQAYKNFEMEKSHYPESSIYMDSLMQRMKGKK